MAELNVKQDQTTRKVRVRKVAPKVDLTAMVDLAFLLITFFMLTTSLNTPHQIDVVVPDNAEKSSVEIDERRIIALIIEEGQLTWYQGDINKPLQPPTSISLQTKALRELLSTLGPQVNQATGGKDMIVMIKPSKDARTIDIIQTLDEMKIANIKRYMLSKTSAQEEAMLANL